MKRTALRPGKPLPRGGSINRKRSQPRRGRIYDSRYLDFIRAQICVVCRYRYPGYGPDMTVQTTYTEAAHVGDRGLGQKCSDRETLPLCAEHHRTGPESHHVLGKRFWEHHGLERGKLIHWFQEAYEAQSRQC